MMSPLSKGSPHSGQNRGALVGSSGCQPHLSQRYWGTPLGFLLPQSEQNLPLFCWPQEQVQLPLSAGLGLPHSGQNLPLAVAPQLHFQPPAGLGSGFLAPHSGQNLPVAVAPQAHFQPFWAGAEELLPAAGPAAGCPSGRTAGRC